MRHAHQFNPVRRAAENAQHHYDIGNDLYRLFLDTEMNYSCAFFEDPERETLEQAQQNKLRRMATKLNLKKGMRVADIGSGWGAAAIHLAKNHGVHVTGISPAKEQVALAKERARAARLNRRAVFRATDYRELQGSFDRIVSIGMMEHVGVAYFDAYFSKIRDLLTEDGIAFVHCIGRMSPPGATSPFIRKYIFPGSYAPSLSEVFAATERSGLWVNDMEVLRNHYSYTLRHWRLRFEANRDKAKAMFDERFCRKREFYLSAMELNFMHGSQMVFQLVLSKSRDAVPIVRDYMVTGKAPAPTKPLAKPKGKVPRKSAPARAKSPARAKPRARRQKSG
jgi:cyclopropane-fatty-acyl-phospholipid synthase